MSEYLKDQSLIGKRAKFKEREDYSRDLWGKTGTIIQHEGMEHIGISLKFDDPSRASGHDMKSCYIAPGSIELIEEEVI